LQKLTSRPSVAPNGTSRAAAVLIGRGESLGDSSQEDRKIGSREFSLGRRAFGAQPTNQVDGGSANPNGLAFARPSDLPIFCENLEPPRFAWLRYVAADPYRYGLVQADWQASKAFLHKSRLLKPGTPPSTGADRQPCIAP
jgi:hypothetical protein